MDVVLFIAGFLLSGCAVISKILRVPAMTAFGLLALIVAAFTSVSGGARAHDWYPLECCHDRDCWVAGSGGKESAPVPMLQGWRLGDGAIIPYAKVRNSPDGQFHVCRQGGTLSGGVICFFAPVQGF